LKPEQLASARDGIGLLLSLLLGFTLAMAPSRFDQRKQLVVDEANAIGTTIVRAQMLPEPARDKMLALLREYVDARIRFAGVGLYGEEFAQAMARGKELQNQMWKVAVDVAKTTPNGITSLFVEALNNSVDLSEKRLSMLENRVPTPLGDVDPDFILDLPDCGYERAAKTLVCHDDIAVDDFHRDGADRGLE
jgi:hypothetical protein